MIASLVLAVALVLHPLRSTPGAVQRPIALPQFLAPLEAPRHAVVCAAEAEAEPPAEAEAEAEAGAEADAEPAAEEGAEDPKAALKAEKAELKEKIAKLEKELVTARGAVAAAKDAVADAGEGGYLLLAANMERFRLKAKEEMSLQGGFGRRAAARELLVFVDEFEALQACGGDDCEAEAAQIHKFYSGIGSQLTKLLGEWKVAPFEASVGDKFDSLKHTKTKVVVTEDAEADTVMEVVGGGYTMDGGVLRGAQVVVAAAPPKEEEAAEEAAEDGAEEDEAAAEGDADDGAADEAE